MGRQSFIRLLKWLGIGLIILVVVGYAVWRSLDYLRGPEIEIFEPTNGLAISLPTVTIIGRADRVNDLKLNGDTLSIDEQGNFKETVIVFPGLNKIRLDGQDQFGRKTSKEIDLVGLNQASTSSDTPSFQ